MKHAWAHLPNAIHIDRIFASLDANWDAWDRTDLDGLRQANCRYKAFSLVTDIGRIPVWRIVGDTLGQADDTWREAAWNALAALMAWDDCAYMLDLEPSELAVLAKLWDDPTAALLLSACIALSKEKEKQK